jgi:hypothetical protein
MEYQGARVLAQKAADEEDIPDKRPAGRRRLDDKPIMACTTCDTGAG